MTTPPTAPKTFLQILPGILLLASAMLINYIDRGNLSIAAPTVANELHLSSTQLGLLFSSFFWTYTIALFFIGWFVDRLDVNWILILGFSLWSLATAATGIARTFVVLLLMRMLLGLGESVAFPSVSKILSTSVTESFRGVANGICIAAVKCGSAIGAFGAGFLIVTYGWRYVLLYIGGLSLLWIPLWLLYSPARGSRSAAPSVTPNRFDSKLLLTLLSQRSFWGTVLGHFGINYILYFMVIWLPLYLVQERHLPPSVMINVAGLYYSADALMTFLAGWLTDSLIRSGYSITRVRKSAMLIGHSFAALGFIACAVLGSRTYFAGLLLIAIGSGTCGYGTYTLSQTLAGPNLSGKWTGFQNGFANFAGVIGPALTGFLVTKTGNFLAPLYITAAVSILGGLAWVFVVGPVEPIKWPSPAAASQVGVPLASS
jgi:MFS transporter, ACS family, D-galactonate transporter